MEGVEELDSGQQIGEDDVGWVDQERTHDTYFRFSSVTAFIKLNIECHVDPRHTSQAIAHQLWS